MVMMANGASQQELAAAVAAHGFALQREGEKWSVTSTWWTPSKVTDDFSGEQIYEDSEGNDYTIQTDRETGQKSLLKLEETGYVLSPPRRDLVAKFSYVPVQLHADQHHTQVYLNRGYLMADPNTGKGDNDNVVLEDAQKFAEAATLPYIQEIERLKAELEVQDQVEPPVPVAPVAVVVPPIAQKPGVLDIPDQDLTAFQKVIADLNAPVDVPNPIAEAVQPQTVDVNHQIVDPAEVQTEPVTPVASEDGPMFPTPDPVVVAVEPPPIKVETVEVVTAAPAREGVPCSVCVLDGKANADVYYAKSVNGLKSHLGSRVHNPTKKRTSRKKK